MKHLDRDALEQLDRAVLIAPVLAQQARLAAQVEELSGTPPSPLPPRSFPPFVKPSRLVKEGKRPRKWQVVNFARHRGTPTRVDKYAVEACPACGTSL